MGRRVPDFYQPARKSQLCRYGSDGPGVNAGLERINQTVNQPNYRRRIALPQVIRRQPSR